MEIVDKENLKSISIDHPAVLKAARWVRYEYDVPRSMTIDQEFEQVLNCKIHRDYNSHRLGTIEFTTASDAMLFVLKWS